MAKIHKYIDLSNLPRTGNKINWKNSIGCKVYFEYKSENGYVIIHDYDSVKRIISYNYKNKEYNQSLSGFTQVQFNNIVDDKSLNGDFRFNIGCVIKDNQRDMIIINQEKKGYRKYYTYKCNKDGYIGSIYEYDLINGVKCSCCDGKSVVKGVNDIATTNPEILKYLENIEDGFKYSKGSGRFVNFKCPDCGDIKSMRVVDLCKNGFSCNKCGDNISYPNKLMYNILQQLNIEFQSEYSPEWIKPKRFDFYIPSKNLIIEMDGYFHTNIHQLGKRTLEQHIEDDVIKDTECENHGIKIIRIDCDYNKKRYRLKYIKNSILNSELKNFINLDQVDWLECDKYSLINKTKEFCEFYEENKFNKTIGEMCEIFKIGRDTGTKYLQRGSKHNWCKYIPREKRVKVVELNEEFPSVNNCCNELSRRFDVNFSVASVLRRLKDSKEYKGFHFEYVS